MSPTESELGLAEGYYNRVVAGLGHGLGVERSARPSCSRGSGRSDSCGMADWIRQPDPRAGLPQMVGGTMEPHSPERSSAQLNPPAGGHEVKTLGDHLAKALTVVQVGNRADLPAVFTGLFGMSADR